MEYLLPINIENVPPTKYKINLSVTKTDKFTGLGSNQC